MSYIDPMEHCKYSNNTSKTYDREFTLKDDGVFSFTQTVAAVLARRSFNVTWELLVQEDTTAMETIQNLKWTGI